MAQPVSHNRPATELIARPNGQDWETFRPSSNRHSPEPGYEWVALSVTTVGALLASLQGSSLIIALPDVLTRCGLSSSPEPQLRGRESERRLGTSVNDRGVRTKSCTSEATTPSG
jgi:hypothetical protein